MLTRPAVTQILLDTYEKHSAPSPTTPHLSRGNSMIHSIPDRRAQDAEEFELGGLLSDEETNDDSGPVPKETRR